MPDFLLVYILASSRAEAEKIAETLVGEALAGCCNIFDGVRSIYRWQGKVERADECAMIAKTSAEKLEMLMNRVKELHSYECPCIVATPIVAGSEAYLEWLKSEV
ncbi:MAG: divalent-cation tolerance protein CutA [Alphaproteobacteria bacterium]|nr:divalent-cation tolerance protein CutA [Alphaproteobacteria bacterium]